MAKRLGKDTLCISLSIGGAESRLIAARRAVNGAAGERVCF